MAYRLTSHQHALPAPAGQRTNRCRPALQRAGAGALVILALAACSRGNGPAVELPATPVALLRPEWAVVSAQYVRLREEPTATASITGHLRAGDVARIASVGTRVDVIAGARYRWYELVVDGLSGWAHGSAVRVFATRRQAENASEGPAGG